MNQRILVTYATRTGSTVGVASAIGETLAARGYRVDVKPVNENPSLDDYQAVIMGSAVNGGQWLPEAVEFVKNHQQTLKQMPVALFCVHGINMGDDERSQKWRYAYLNAIRPLSARRTRPGLAARAWTPRKQMGLFGGLPARSLAPGKATCATGPKSAVGRKR